MSKRLKLPIQSKAYLYLVVAIVLLSVVGIWAALDLAMDMVRYSAFLSVAAVLIILPLLVWLVGPLRDLERAAELLNAGDLHTPLAVTHHRELERLAVAFEGLRGRVLDGARQKDRLLVDVSHEMKGPLARIRLAVDLLEDECGAHDLLEQIKVEVALLSEMVSDVLERARMAHGAPIVRKPVDLEELVRQLVTQRARVAQEKFVQVHLALQPAVVAGDRVLMGRAIGNVLDNALKYAQPGCEVTVTTERDGGEAVVRIRDTGVGIPAGDLPHIFEPFYRPDISRTRETGGAGLGLSIAKVAVEAHGGTLRLSSQVGEGTEVEIRLPDSAELY